MFLSLIAYILKIKWMNLTESIQVAHSFVSHVDDAGSLCAIDLPELCCRSHLGGAESDICIYALFLH